jgi:hypothetical protein
LTLAAESSNSIRWLSSTTALLIGTGGEEWAMRGATEGAPITPTNIRAERQSGYSSMPLGATMAHEVTVFVQRDGRRVRQLSYTDAQQSFTAGDLTVFAPHVTEGGVRQMAFQQAPTAVLWAVTSEGKLCGMTFELAQEVFGWHVHDTDGEIETVAVLHSTPADEVWCGVKRKVVVSHDAVGAITTGSPIVTLADTDVDFTDLPVSGNGIPDGTSVISKSDGTITLSKAATVTDASMKLTFHETQVKRYVERMQPQAMASDWKDAPGLVYADSALSFQIKRHTQLVGEDAEALNQVPTLHRKCPIYAVTEIDGTLQPWVLVEGDEEQNVPAGIIRPVDFSPDNERYWQKAFDFKLRVDHLEGKRVVILTDGAIHPPKEVKQGLVELDYIPHRVVVGLPYTSELQPMKQELPLENGTAQGRRFKLHGVTMRVDHSLGGEVSANAEDATLPWTRVPHALVLGEATPLFSGERDMILESRHESAVNLVVRQREPLPLNITALILRFDVYDN